MTMRSSPTARRSSSETFEQVNQMLSGVNPACRAMDLAGRHRIAAEAVLPDQVKHGQTAVRLHRVKRPEGKPREGALHPLDLPPDHRRVVDVQRRAEAAGQVESGDAGDVQDAVGEVHEGDAL